MSISIRPGADEDEMIAVINTTPLVDIMLVLLIIFLITVPVVIHTVPLSLPKDRDQPNQTRPGNIVISVDRQGAIYWNDQRIPDAETLLTRLKAAAPHVPQPEVQIRGDREVRYEFIGKVVTACQRVGIAKIAFITQPQPHGG